MSSVFARKEETNSVPFTPVGNILVQEIKELARKLKAEEFLSACSNAAVHVEQNMADAAAYLLVLDVEKRSINIRPFPSMMMANLTYTQAERENRGKDHLQTVLVSVDSIGALRKAYPNYYLDVSEFLGELKKILRSST